MSQGFANVWDAVEDDPAERTSLKLRSDLMDALDHHIRLKEWTPAEAALHLGLSPARLDDFIQGRIDDFSVDCLLAMAATAGLRIHVQVDAAA